MSLGIRPLDDKYLTGIFEDLAQLEVQLDSDPLVYGPKRLNQKVALVRKMATRCERMFLDAAQKHAAYKRSQRAADLILDMSMKHLLANDPETRSGRAVSEREAIASGKLKTEVQEVAAAKQAIEDLEAVIAVIKAKRADLRDIQGRLRDQMRLCQEEIGLGGRWGSKSPRGVELQPGQGFADGDDTAAMDAVIASVRKVEGAETHLTAEVDDTDDADAVIAALVSSADDTDDALLASFGDDDDAPTVVKRSEPVLSIKSESPGPGVRVFHVAAPPAPVANGTLSDDSPEIISGDKLKDEFGFVPHCEVCGEPQFRTYSGMVCPNGHGGANSVPPAVNALEEDTSGAPTTTVSLPSTSDTDAVAAFLSDDIPVVARPSRRQVEDSDAMDIDSILLNWEP